MSAAIASINQDYLTFSALLDESVTIRNTSAIERSLLQKLLPAHSIKNPQSLLGLN